MCRLTAYVGPEIPLDRLIFGGDHSLLKQSYSARELRSGTVNVDGYGIAWFPAAEPVRMAEARPVWHDPDLGPVLRSIVRPLGLAAVRSATPGIPVDRNAVAPLLHDRWAFALNGFIWDFRASAMRSMRRDLPDHLYAALSGVSDTETIFLTAVAARGPRRGGGTAESGDHGWRRGRLHPGQQRPGSQLPLLEFGVHRGPGWDPGGLGASHARRPLGAGPGRPCDLRPGRSGPCHRADLTEDETATGPTGSPASSWAPGSPGMV
jgi:hypothetical protein